MLIMNRLDNKANTPTERVWRDADGNWKIEKYNANLEIN